MLSHPEGRAWAILVTSFAVFCALAVGCPLSVRWYVVNAAEPMDALLKPLDGAVDVKEPAGTQFISVDDSRLVGEGTAISTDEHRAFLRLFEQSTLTLYNGTEVLLAKIRSPTYAASSRHNQVQVQVERGRVVIGVAPPAPPLERGVDIVVTTPQASMALEEGSYSVVVGESETQVTVVRPGGLLVTAGDEQRRIASGRCRIVQGQSIEGPLPLEQDLIVNGDFASILERGWEVELPQRQKESDPYGQVQVVMDDGKAVLSFVRRGAETHGENGIVQRIDKDVRDFSLLRLACEVLVNDQSLRGGGYESTEFPVMIELRYRDTFGNQRSRYWGFYYLDPGTGPEWRTIVNGIKVVEGEWYFFETANLMQSMSDAPPVYVEHVRVYASGWDWDSAVTNISLLVQE